MKNMTASVLARLRNVAKEGIFLGIAGYRKSSVEDLSTRDGCRGKV